MKVSNSLFILFAAMQFVPACIAKKGRGGSPSRGIDGRGNSGRGIGAGGGDNDGSSSHDSGSSHDNGSGSQLRGPPGHSQSGGRRYEGRPERRSCQATAQSNMVAFGCSAPTNNATTEIQDKIDFVVQTDNGLCITVEYKPQVNDTETEAEFDVCMDRLIEYRNTTLIHEEAYDWENDQVIQTLNLTEWLPLSNVTTDNENISIFSASTPDDLVTLTFAMSPDGDHGRVTPNKIKFDVRIVNFPWQANDSYVALVSHVKSKLKVETEDENDVPQQIERSHMKPKDAKVSFKNATETVGYSPFGEFTWAETALVNPDVSLQNGTMVQVVATSPTEYRGSYQPIAFSFVGDAARSATDIFFDPEAGVGYISSDAFMISSLGVIFGFVGVILLI